ncbi:MAG: DNA repair protein RadC [Spirochaetales bacterium]|nr:DNA repair protein RadC [Spirochaetales bacterium]
MVHYGEDALLPREKLFAQGPGSLSDQELLCLLFGTGTRGKDVFRLAGEVLSLLDTLEPSVLPETLLSVRGIGTAKVALLTAALEFSRRVLCPGRNRIHRPKEILPLIRHYAERKQECLLSLSLNGAHEVMSIRVVSVGLVNRTVVHPREVFADPLTERAAALLVAHNHPSGNLEPSGEDAEVTSRLKQAGDILGIPLLDHIIFTTDAYFSFLEEGLL